MPYFGLSLLAQAYANAGKMQQAREEFISSVNRYGGFEAQAEYALWALSVGDVEAAQAQYRILEQTMKRWSKQTRSLHKAMIKRLETAFSASRTSSS